MPVIVSKRHPSAAAPTIGKTLDEKVYAILGEHLEAADAYLGIMMRCRSCGKRYEWGGGIDDLENFDDYYNLCGGSDRCIP